MSLKGKCLLLLLGAAITVAAGKDDQPFKARPVSDYPAKQTISKVTIAVEAFDEDGKAQEAFGKKHPYQFGVLPVLVVIQNNSDKALNLDQMKVEYQMGRTRVEATPAADVPFIIGPNKPNMIPGPIPTRPKVTGKKNPLRAEQIQMRAFSARMLPPGDSASGFFYFQTQHRGTAEAYVSGIREAATGQELFYFEIPFSGELK
jgi:hypothetical protein